MDALSPSTTFNSRRSREPSLYGGREVVVRPTERDLEIFRLLARYRYLPADVIQAFIGGGAQGLRRRLNFLSRKPNLYLCRPHQQYQRANANHRQTVYELDERGARCLEEHGMPAPAKSRSRAFAHEFMVAQIIASIELGTLANPAIRLISWAEILTHPSTPSATKSSRRQAIPVAFQHRGETCKIEICADAEPFGLERITDGKSTYLFFPGIEADCGTEPIDTSDIERSSIYKKFLAYRAITDQALYRAHFGFPNFFVPFITTNTVRMRSMMALLDRVTGGRGAKMFLFRTFPHFAAAGPAPPADGHMLIGPWSRVGFEPFVLTA